MGDGSNRRREKRMQMTSTAAVKLECGDCTVDAFLVDLSRHGAGFRIEECPDGLDLHVGDEVSGTLTTNYGDSGFKAKVAWARKDGSKCDFGVEILDME
jgi:hypothetical protein